MTKKQPGSRELALQILYQVNEEGAYANLALDKALFPCTWLDPRDRGFITEIVYGSVKNRGKLDYVLNQFSRILPEQPRLSDFLFRQSTRFGCRK